MKRSLATEHYVLLWSFLMIKNNTKPKPTGNCCRNQWGITLVAQGVYFHLNEEGLKGVEITLWRKWGMSVKRSLQDTGLSRSNEQNSKQAVFSNWNLLQKGGYWSKCMSSSSWGFLKRLFCVIPGQSWDVEAAKWIAVHFVYSQEGQIKLSPLWI